MANPPEDGKTRKDSAACVSLSSYALVKEHDGKTVVWAPGFWPCARAAEAFAEAISPHILHIESRGKL